MLYGFLRRGLIFLFGLVFVPTTDKNKDVMILLFQLRLGTTGILHCQINGTLTDEKEVTWVKLLEDPKSNKTLAILDVNTGEISGPGHEDGGFNIRKDFCLVINNVKAEDEGTYYCKIKHNASGTTSTEGTVRVEVFDEKTPPFQLRLGATGMLPCQINGTLTDTKEVTWMKLLEEPMSNKTLVILDVKTGKIRRPGHEDGMFRIGNFFSLVINNVKAEDEGTYYCKIKHNANGTTSSEGTVRVEVFVSNQDEKTPPFQLRLGTKGMLPCQINGTLTDTKEVTWVKLLEETMSNKTLVILDVKTGKISGTGHKDEMFRIGNFCSLVINNVKAEDEGTYYCKIKHNANGTTFSEGTVSVEVFAGTTMPTGLISGSRKEVPWMKVLEFGVNAGKRNEPGDESSLKVTDAYTLKEVLRSFFVLVLTILAGSAITSLIESSKGVLSYREFKYSDRISYYELWKLTKYADEFKEQDTLKKAVKLLISDSLTENLYESLRSWKVKCDNLARPINQPEEIYKRCSDAGMVKSSKKLRDLRLIVSNVVDATSSDLEHVLWQIGKQSVDNIIGLLGELKVDGVVRIVHMVDDGSRLTEIVVKATEMLVTWKEGFVSMNPIVKLSLASEKLKLSAGEYDLIQVPEYSKHPLSEMEIKENVHAATIKHCKKIGAVITSQGRSKDVLLINQKPSENNEILFNTYQMITDWLEGQECSNYEKRRKIQDALCFVHPSESDDELFNADVIKERASGDKKKIAEVAYDLLMIDIQPFARALGVDKNKLQEYKVQTQDPSQLTMGTAGLVAMLVGMENHLS